MEGRLQHLSRYRFVSTFLEVVTAELAASGEVPLQGFGRFFVKARAERLGRTPGTGAEMEGVQGRVIPRGQGAAGGLELIARKETHGGRSSWAAFVDLEISTPLTDRLFMPWSLEHVSTMNKPGYSSSSNSSY